MLIDNITITDIKDIMLVSSPKGRHARIENRHCYGLSFCIDGQITYTHNGQSIVSDKNCAVILPQGETYTLKGDKNGSFPVINFTCTEKLCDTVISFPIQNAASYISDFKKLRALSLFDGNRAEMMSIFYRILNSLSHEGSACKTIMPAVKYIEENYCNPDISNAFLAELCNISEIYFRRLFKEHYKTTPRQFIIDIRIKKAEQLLCEGRLKIYAVAEKCGFTNQYHFSEQFKEKTGLTPSEYMKLNKNLKI